MKEEKIKKIKINKKTMIIISTILVLFIPMLYSTIYLGAFWDPYDNLENVPVAFVNLDESVIKDEKTYEIGKEVESSLRSNKKLAWKFVDEKTASRGLEENSYYATVTIPKDFSKKISQVSEGKTDDAKIIYSANKGKNYIFSQLSQKATENIKAEVSSNIQKEISKSLVDNMYNIKNSIKEAEQGVEKLQDGTTRLSDGSNMLSDGTLQAEQGSVRLQDGLKDASDGTIKLKNGVSTLEDGGIKLTHGIGSARDGSLKLQMGLMDLGKGEEKIASGTSQLVNGLETLRNNLSEPNDNIDVLVNGANSLSEYNTKLARGTEQLNNLLNSDLNDAAENLKTVSRNIDTISGAMSSKITVIENSDISDEDKEALRNLILSLEKVNQGSKNSNVENSLIEASHILEPLSQNMNKLEGETKKVSKGVSLMASTLEETQGKAKSGVEKLIVGAKEIENGSQTLLTGLNTASQKTGELSGGLTKAYEGSSSLRDGLTSAKEGTISLNQGLETAYLKTGDLTDGLKSLNTGANSLSSGLGELEIGSGELKTGLSDGYLELDNKLKFKPQEMADFVANPVSIEEESINDINHYGEGLAPYFISLSLWLGAMFINLIISITKKIKNKETDDLKSFTKDLLLGILLVCVQSLILSISLRAILKIEVVSLLGFFLSNMFISIVFFSLMYGVSFAIGIIGTPIMFIFFLLQISSAGGTFPIETAPTLYRTLNGIIPMTYAVNLLRMVVSGINDIMLSNTVTVLLEFIVLSLTIGYLVNLIIRKIKEKNIENKKSIEI